MLEAIQSVLTDQAFIGAVSTSVLIILLGYFLGRKGIISPAGGKMLAKLVLTAALPFLAFNSFMQNIDPESLRQGMNLLVLGFVFHIALIFLTKVFYIKYRGNVDKSDILRVLTVFGSTTFFGIPIIAVLYPEGVLGASIFNIGYRVFLYSYGYIVTSGLKMKRENIKEMILNPIVIATLLGMLIWIFQDSLPQVTVAGAEGPIQAAFARVDLVAPWLFRPMTTLAGLASPLAWISIGVTLSQVKVQEAAASKESWYYSVIKLIVIPLGVTGILFLTTVTGIFPVDFLTVAVTFLMAMTPPATVAVAFSISSDREAVLSSNISLLATIVTVILLPIMLIILQVINSAGIF
ncbi:MAG: AEC family transporter [Streptococcaceae bacterium]|jgi:predicted permease|nr:AEC family transporter [Streptococcaceae bacterium]